jgi:hypothetical protein
MSEHKEAHAAPTKVVFDLPPDAPTPTETLWALPLGDHLYRLDNVPWFAFGCALGDVIRCEERLGELPRYVEVVEPGGNWTVRVFVPETPQRDVIKNEVFEMLREMGCSYEGFGATKGLIAVTIPSDLEADTVLDKLRELQAQEKAYWESGNF